MLNVYRASAGSGKTYQLTLEYIKLLLAPPEREEGLLPDERQRLFRRILAVTFTNKATDEMKQRIIKQLDILAHTPQESGYLDKLLGRDGITHDIDTLKNRRPNNCTHYCTTFRASTSVRSTDFSNKSPEHSCTKSDIRADTI